MSAAEAARLLAMFETGQTALSTRRKGKRLEAERSVPYSSRKSPYTFLPAAQFYLVNGIAGHGHRGRGHPGRGGCPPQFRAADAAARAAGPRDGSAAHRQHGRRPRWGDRKSTRRNSSHVLESLM